MEPLIRMLILFTIPLVLFLYWKILRNQQARLSLLFLLSIGFYSLAGLKFIPVLLGLSILTYWLARRDQISLGIILNLSALILFKYWDFGAGRINILATAINLPILLPLLKLALPLGLSYYIFKHIGYLLDIRKHRYPVSDKPFIFLTYSIFFPQISAGPISSYNDTGKQLSDLPKKLSAQQSYYALLYISFGLTKKILIADQLNQLIQQNFYVPGDPQAGFLTVWAFLILSGLQLYFDFSGYTDIALGAGHLFGITLPENFGSPYLAKSPKEFWERWHISLSLWFRIYIFSPLSRVLLIRLGSKHRLVAQISANIITMALVGFWHGAGWGFLLWGVYHGILISTQAFITSKNPNWFNSPFSLVITITAIFAGWVFFFVTGVSNIALALTDMLGLNGLGSFQGFEPEISMIIRLTFPLAILIAFSGYSEARNFKDRYSPKLAAALGVLLAILVLSSGQISDFSYAQF